MYIEDNFITEIDGIRFAWESFLNLKEYICICNNFDDSSFIREVNLDLVEECKNLFDTFYKDEESYRKIKGKQIFNQGNKENNTYL